MKRRNRKRRKRNLEGKVIKFKPLNDENGKYIPFCDFDFHRGISLKSYICEERNCCHYQKLYIIQKPKDL